MSAHACKKTLFLNRLKTPILVAIGLILVFSTPCWSKSFADKNKKGTHRIRKSVNDNPRLAEKIQSKKVRPHKKLSYEKKQRLKKKEKEWKKMSPEKQDELRNKLYKLRNLPLKERTLYKKRFKQLKELPLDDQVDIRNKLKKMDRLSPEEKEAIRKKFNSQ